jgi:acetyl esterase/lipase
MNWNYAGSKESMEEATAFPGGHDLAGMPPTLAIDADRDSLRASGQAFVMELQEAGVLVDYHVVPGSTHGFLDRPGTPGFEAGIDLISTRLSGMSEFEAR